MSSITKKRAPELEVELYEFVSNMIGHELIEYGIGGFYGLLALKNTLQEQVFLARKQTIVAQFFGRGLGL